MSSLENLSKEFENNPKKAIRKTILWLIGLGILLSVIGYGVRILLLPAKTATEILEKTLDADNVLHNYEFFKSQYSDWKGINSKIKSADASVARFKEEAGERKDWAFEDKNEYSRLNSIADGLKFQREDIESEYNAKSQMLNRELFKTNDLPAKLENGSEDRTYDNY